MAIRGINLATPIGRHPERNRRRSPSRTPGHASDPLLANTYRVDAPQTLGEFLTSLFPEASGRTRKQMLAMGRVRVNGSPARLPLTPLQTGDQVEIGERTAPPPRATPLPPNLAVLYEDALLLVVEKGPGLLTIATTKERERTVYAYLNAHLRSHDPQARVFIVHRLDQLASGLLVFALSLESKRTLQTQIARHDVERVYVTVVEGRTEAEGVIRSRLLETSSGRVRATESSGAEAVTHYRALLRGKRYSTLEVRLETGRKHQIRVHLAGLGHPVVGDPLYGSGSGPIGRLALHARTLGFTHPQSGERVRFDSPVPAVFRKLRS